MDGTRTGVIARLRSIACAALAVGPLALAIVNPHADAADAPDGAARFAVGSPEMLAAERIARDTWGYDPCGGAVTISWTQLQPTYNATSTWTNATDGYANPTANYDCHVEFNTAMTFDWPKFCTVLVHEFGHLTGHPHAVDPNDVMTPVYGAPLPACRAMPEPTAAAPAAPAVAAVPVTRKVLAKKVKTVRAATRTNASRTEATAGA